jgi:ElaB/YqjD/DUF883 family membrane-anchored ribosome-binding protein
MTSTPGASDNAAVAKAAQGNSKQSVDVQALRRDIAQTRAELGETVQALAAKADVKARLYEKAEDARERVRDGLQVTVAAAPAKAQALVVRTGQAVRRNPLPFAVAAGAVAVVVLFVRWRRSR